MSAKVMVLVLTSGVELVGEATHNELLDTWSVSKPLKHFQFPVPVPTPNGMGIQIMSQLIPAFAATGDQSFEVNQTDLLFKPTEAPVKLRSAWVQATTGLQVPQGDTPKIIM